MPDTIARAFNRSGATQTPTLDISKAFNSLWHVDFFPKTQVLWNLKWDIWPYFFSLSIRCLWVVLVGRSLQEYQLNAGVSQASILGPTLFFLYINNIPHVICSYLYWWYYSLQQVWQGIWFEVTTRVLWTWILPTRRCRMEKEVTCWFHCWTNASYLIWPVL